MRISFEEQCKEAKARTNKNSTEAEQILQLRRANELKNGKPEQCPQEKLERDVATMTRKDFSLVTNFDTLCGPVKETIVRIKDNYYGENYGKGEYKEFVERAIREASMLVYGGNRWHHGSKEYIKKINQLRDTSIGDFDIDADKGYALKLAIKWKLPRLIEIIKEEQARVKALKTK